MKNRNRISFILAASLGGGLSSVALAQRPMPAVVPSSPFKISFTPWSEDITLTTDETGALALAANLWRSYISNDVTINIQINRYDFPNNDTTHPASTSPTELLKSYESVRTALATDVTAEPDDSILSSLPLSGALKVTKPKDGTFEDEDYVTETVIVSDLWVASANAKVLGLGGVAIDAVINFNSAYSGPISYDGSAEPDELNFVSVIAHEIGHALGFTSNVNWYDDGDFSSFANPLDLFRFSDNSVTPGTFGTKDRNLVPGVTAYFDDSEFEYSMATGVLHGDGYSASHWKNDFNIGLMDPTISLGQSVSPGPADFRALDLIGYEIDFSPVPEVSTLCSGALLVLGALRRRRDPQKTSER